MVVDWTKKRAGAVTVRTVSHYGHPNCAHRPDQRTARIIDGLLVVNCACGMEQRTAVGKPTGFPRQRRG